MLRTGPMPQLLIDRALRSLTEALHDVKSSVARPQLGILPALVTLYFRALDLSSSRLA